MTHTMSRPATLVALASLLALGAAAASAQSAAAAAPAAKSAERMIVTIPFVARNGSQVVTCGRPITDLGSTKATAQLRDLRFYVSNVRLVRKDGSSRMLDLLPLKKGYTIERGGNRTTLIDLENGRGMCNQGDRAMNTVIRGSVPAGRYVGLHMYLGVPFPLNHSDTVAAPRPLDLASMAWSWQAGRKFAKIEITDPQGATGTWQTPTFNFHLGSTGCVGNPATGATASCGASNRVTVRFARYNPKVRKVAINLRALFAGNDVTRNRAGAAGCMSGPTDPECGPVFRSLDLSWKADGSGTGQVLKGGPNQTLFRRVLR